MSDPLFPKLACYHFSIKWYVFKSEIPPPQIMALFSIEDTARQHWGFFSISTGMHGSLLVDSFLNSLLANEKPRVSYNHLNSFWKLSVANPLNCSSTINKLLHTQFAASLDFFMSLSVSVFVRNICFYLSFFRDEFRKLGPSGIDIFSCPTNFSPVHPSLSQQLRPTRLAQLGRQRI